MTTETNRNDSDDIKRVLVARLRLLRKIVAYGVAMPILLVTLGATLVFLRAPPGDQLGILGMRTWSVLQGVYASVSGQVTARTPRTVVNEEPPPADGMARLRPELAAKVNAFVEVVVPRQEIRLIDRAGDTLHVWSTAEIVNRIERSGYLPDGTRIVPRRAEPLPGGDLLVVMTTPDASPYGAGLARMNPDGSVDWLLKHHIHHDVAVSGDGEFAFAPYQERAKEAVTTLSRAGSAPRMSEGLVKVDIEAGRVMKKLPFTDLFARSPYAVMVNDEHLDDPAFVGDVYHANSVARFGDAAKAYTFADPRDLLVSFRELDMVAAIDPRDRKVDWAVSGPWESQHEAVPRPDGDIKIFDNLGARTDKGWRSRVLAFDPTTMQVTDQVSRINDGRFLSRVYGVQRTLPNGNTLVVVSKKGRAAEVTPDDQTAWRYAIDERVAVDEGRRQIVDVLADLAPVNKAFVRRVRSEADNQSVEDNDSKEASSP